MKNIGFVLMHRQGPVVQSQGSAKLYLTEAAARGARTNMFGSRHWQLSPEKRRERAAAAADIVPVYA